MRPVEPRRPLAQPCSRAWLWSVTAAFTLAFAGCEAGPHNPPDASSGGAEADAGSPSGAGGAGPAGTGGAGAADGGSADVGGSVVDAVSVDVTTVTDAAASADGSANPSIPQVPANARLQPRQLEAEGAPPLVLGIWDTKEKVHCQFVLDEKGEQRCLPDAVANVVATESYADAQCTVPFFWLQPDAAAMRKGTLDRPWSRVLSGQMCEAARYQILRPVATKGTLYALKSGVCKVLPTTEQSSPSQGDLPFVADPPDRWEKGTDTNVLRASERLRVIETVTPDGAHFVKGFADDHWSMGCTLSPSKTKTGLECVPPKIDATGSYYADNECKMQLFGVPACSAVAFIEDYKTRYALSAAFVGSVYYSAKGCELREMATAAPAVPHYYAKGAALGDDAVAPVSETTAGTGRFRVRGFARSDGSFISVPSALFSYFSYKYFDADANEDCQPIWDVNGKVRCISAFAHVDRENYFSDRECTRHLTYCDGPTCATTKIVLTRRDVSTEPRAYAAYSGAILRDKSDVFYRDVGGACLQAGAASDGWVEPKGEIPLDGFPVLRERYPLPTQAALP